MTSRRVFELANSIHAELASQCHSSHLFGGKQVILVGDFLQLRPVANFFDLGQFVFESPLFMAIPHRIELKTLLRQKEDEKEFVACLREIRLGKCGGDSLAFLKSLSRDIAEELISSAVHIFFRRLPVEIFNLNILFSFPDPLHKFEAKDEGNLSGIHCPANQVVMLKPGCKVMLLWNKSDTLVNGTQGEFVGVRGDDVIVDFNGEGQVLVKRETWTNISRMGDVVGNRSQFPLALMWAITCHKSQGLTLPSAVVHCTKEFVPGLMYVALSRVKSSEHLKVVDFSPNQLLRQLSKCLDVCAQHTNVMEEDLKCCRKKALSEEFLKIDDGFKLPNEEGSGHEGSEVESESTENLVKSYFEREEPDEIAIDLQTVYFIISDEASNDFCKIPPPTFSVTNILEKMKVKNPLSEFAIENNRVVEDIITSNPHKDIIGMILWSRACTIILEESLLNFSEVKLSTSAWLNDFKELYMLITQSASFMRDMEMFFDAKPLNSVQSAIGAFLMMGVYKDVAKCVADKVERATVNDPLAFDVKAMPSEGLGKIRHIGAWAIRKVVSDQKRYVRSNMMSTNEQTRLSVLKRLKLASLLEEHVIANFEALSASTQYPETLAVSEDRQFRNRGLSHIEDLAFEFFLEAEATRVSCLNDHKLALYGEHLVSQTESEMKGDRRIRQKWLDCFPVEEKETKMVSCFKCIFFLPH